MSVWLDLRGQSVGKIQIVKKYIYYFHICYFKVTYALFLGIHNKPSEKCFFSNNPLLSTPIFNQMFTEERVYLLNKFLHFNDNSHIDEFVGEQRLLYKISPIIMHLRKKFMEAYTPSKEVCIDESLLLWKGRLRYKVYMPLKSSKFGIKYYQLCESRTGYVYNFFVYLGKSTEFEYDFCDFSFGAKVILQLSKNIWNLGYRITMDNFFTSIKLFEYLSQKETDCLGTVRINRIGIPKSMKEKKLKKNEHFILYKSKCCITNR